MTTTYTIIRKEELTVSQWSGGTTTQLAIYPPEASYAERTFLWRVSTARVDARESLFTSLPGVRRILMVLDGEMELTHEGHHTKRLAAFEQDAFEGGWTTRSYGRVTDFNLMFTEGTGRVEALPIPPSESVGVTLAPGLHGDLHSAVLYFLSGAEVGTDDGRSHELHAGDVMIISPRDGEGPVSLNIVNPASVGARVIMAEVHHRG